jgi:hypothetical protein
LDEAEKSAREVVVRKANFAEAYLLLADIHVRQNNFSALLKDLDDYLKLDPDSATSVITKAIRDGARRALYRRTKVKIQEANGRIVVLADQMMGFLEVLDRRGYEVQLVKNSPEHFRAGSRTKIKDEA